MTKKGKLFVTFGQVHTHSINGKTFDKNCVAVIRCASWLQGRKKALEYFGPKFCMDYFEEEFKEETLSYYPRGLIEVEES